VASDGESVESRAVDWLVNDSIRGNLSFVGGILGGGIAYVLGFISISGLFLATEESQEVAVDPATVIPLLEEDAELVLTLARIAEGAPETPATAVKFLSWVFYGAHGINIQVANEGAVNMLGLFAESTLIYTLIPAVLLFGLGGLVALLKRADGLLGGVLSGGSVVMGYFPLVLIGAIGSGISGDGATASVQVLPAILLAGILYPLLCGGAAGLLKVLVINVAIGGLRDQL